jgi:hypothetical protein
MTGPRLFLSYFASSAVAGQSVKHRIPYPKKMYLHLVNTMEGFKTPCRQRPPKLWFGTGTSIRIEKYKIDIIYLAFQYAATAYT